MEKAKVFFYGLWQAVMAWSILLVISVISPVIFFYAGVISIKSSSSNFESSIPYYLVNLTLIFIFSSLPLLFLIYWVVKSLKKFKSQGIKTHSATWIILLILPTIIIVFPLFLIFRNIIWPKKLGTYISPKFDSHSLKLSMPLTVFLVIFVFFIVGSVVSSLNPPHTKAEIDAVVNSALSKNCNGTSGCDELRPLPGPLQNKKIVFAKNTEIQFDPTEDKYKENSELDLLGDIDTQPYFPGSNTNFVDPALKQRGDLEEREYKIIRAVYHYNCWLCVDSSDYSYIVLEDSKGNRFSSFLDDSDDSVYPPRDRSWDEYIPFFLEKGKDGKPSTEAKLEDASFE